MKEKQKYLKGLGHRSHSMKLKNNPAPWGDGKLEFVWVQDYNKGAVYQQFLAVEQSGTVIKFDNPMTSQHGGNS